MIATFIRKVIGCAKEIFPFYDFGTFSRKNYAKSNRNELIDEIKWKTALVHKLNNKLKYRTALGPVFCFVYMATMFAPKLLTTENKMSAKYVAEVTWRLKNNADRAKDSPETEMPRLFKKGGYAQTFERISARNAHEAKWISALCNMHLNNTAEAKIQLVDIVGSKGVYSVSAKELLDKQYQCYQKNGRAY